MSGHGASRPNQDTDLHVQRLLVGLCPETGIGPQGLAGVETFVSLRPATRRAGFLFINHNH